MTQRRPTLSSNARDPIAIIGIGCRFPGGADSPEAFWRLLCDGVEAITEIPPDRFDVETLYDPRPAQTGKIMTRWGGFIKDIDQFDATFFSISPREAERLDPQQRLLLEVGYEALEDAGQPLDRLTGSHTGVFVGLWLNDYEARLFADPDRVDFYMTTGSGRYSASGRLSYVFGLQGPSLTIDTACSSSLVAVHLACRSLWSGECELALAGGANVILQPQITIAYSQSQMMSPDGRCKFGDADANGYVRSDGAGMVVLKPLARAVADGDPIYALIRGSAVNNDGRSSGFLTTPGTGGQEEMLRCAYADAGIAPGQIQYVEAHGTGTNAGDPVEIQALGTVLAEGRPASQPCRLGSVKTNIGHTEGAAGVAGLIKVALSLHHHHLPASLHFTKENPNIPWQTLPVQIQNVAGPWPEPHASALAGVSSFGIAGTNAHVVLQTAPEAKPDRASPAPAYVLPLSAQSLKALQAVAQRYRELLTNGPRYSLADIAYTAAVRRTHHEHRLTVAGRSPAELAEALAAFSRGEARPGLFTGRPHSPQSPGVVFVFPGQGSQWLGMGRQLLEQEPVFRAAIERCAEAFRPFVDWSLLEQLTADAAHSRLDEIDVVQPMLFAMQAALAALWRAWGVEPEAVIGHSMGEVAAAHVAGALSLEDAAAIICRRSRLMRRVSGQGAMAVVGLSLEQAQSELAGYEDQLAVAVSNSPRSTVLSGDPAALEAVLTRLQARGVFCRRVKVDVASHSPQMDGLREDLLRAVSEVRPQPTTVPMFSTVTGQRVEGATLTAEYWIRNLRQPVLFSRAVQQAAQAGPSLFIEISPHPILLTAVEETLAGEGRHSHTLPTLVREEDELVTMLGSLGALHTLGYQVDWSRRYPAGGRTVRLPTYPWQRRRYWLESPAAASGAAWDKVETGHPLLGVQLPALADLPGRFIWQNRPGARFQRGLRALGIDPATPLTEHVFAEMAQAAARIAFGDRLHLLKEVHLHSPLTLLTEGGPELQVSLSAPSATEAVFNVYSRANDGWKTHASGSLQLSSAEARWLYQMEWRPQLLPAAPVAPEGQWLIVRDAASDSDALSAALAEQLASQAQHCVMVRGGEAFARAGEREWTINPARREDFERLLAEAFADERRCRGVIYLSVATPAAGVNTAEELASCLAVICGGALHLAQALARASWRETPRLWLVTRGAQPVGVTVPDPTQAALWGLGRVIAREQPELWGGLLDLDRAPTPAEVRAIAAEMLIPPTGEQVALRGGQRFVARLTPMPIAATHLAPLSAEGSYWITGGLGGLGLRLAEWLVERGVRHLALTGRRIPTPAAETVLRKLEAAGARVLIIRGDVAQWSDVQRAMAEMQAALPPLRGVFHAAGVLDDGMLHNLDWDRFASVLAPKVLGAWNLHRATRELALEHVVFFSSASALLGLPGQGNYAAANAFMDALAHQRRAEGLPALSVNWGVWGEAGLATTAERQASVLASGFKPIAPEAGLEALGYALCQPTPQLAVMDLDWPSHFQTLTALRPAFQELLISASQPQEDYSSTLAGAPLRQQLEAAAVDARLGLLATQMRTQVKAVMRFDAEFEFDDAVGFFQLGMDSLMAVELKNRLQAGLGLRLTATLAFDYPTVTTLSHHLFEQLFPQEAAPEDSVADDTAAELAALSRDEVKALLDEELTALEEGVLE